MTEMQITRKLLNNSKNVRLLITQLIYRVLDGEQIPNGRLLVDLLKLQLQALNMSQQDELLTRVKRLSKIAGKEYNSIEDFVNDEEFCLEAAAAEC